MIKNQDPQPIFMHRLLFINTYTEREIFVLAFIF
jgi:hypothetical protein